MVIRWWTGALIGLAILAAIAALAAMAVAFWWMADEIHTANATAEKAVCVAEAAARTPVLPELTHTGQQLDPDAWGRPLIYASEVSGGSERSAAVEAC